MTASRRFGARVPAPVAALVVTVLLATGLLATAGPASAASRISQVSTSEQAISFQLALRAGELAAASAPGAVTVTLNGRQVPVTVRPLDAAQAPPRSAMLLLDTSGSMAGAGILGAVSAAQAFLQEVPSDVAVGLATFSTTPSLLVAPTTDRGAVASALRTVTAQGETSLYDGVLTALDALRGPGEHSLVLLSDGGDTTSTSSADAMLARLRTSGVALQVVALTTRESATGVLASIAAARGVTPVSVQDAGALAGAFQQAASALSDRVAVEVAVPAALAGTQATLALQLATAAGPVTDSVVLAIPGTAVPKAAAGQVVQVGTWARSGVLTVALVGLFVGLLLLLLLALGVRLVPEDSAHRTRRVLSRYTLERRPVELRPEESAALGQSAVARSALQLAGRVVRREGVEERIALKLDRAAVPLRPAEWVLIRVGACGVGFALFTVLAGNLLVGLLIGVALGLAGTAGWLSFKATRRLRAFAEALPESLTLIAGSLSTGYSLPQALDTVVREGLQPMSGEIGRALAQARLGVPIEDALEAVAVRMDSRDFSWAVMAVRIQREVGGNLSEVLRTAVATLRERAQLRRQVLTLSAEGRLSAYILVGLPLLMAVYMLTLRRDYIRPLYTEGLGIAMLAGAGVLLVLGALWMRNLVKVEV